MKEYLIPILISGTLVILFALTIVARIRYSIFLDEVRKVNPEWSENMNGLFGKDGGEFVWGFGEYWFRPPFPITFNTKNKRIKEARIKHNQTIKLFWIVMISWIPLLIVVSNLIE